MSKAYKPNQPEQDLLLPPSLKDWRPEKHLAYFVSDVVDELDLSGIEAVYEKELRGQRTYDGAGWSSGNGARSASRSDEHVHCPGKQR
jgi:transposase